MAGCIFCKIARKEAEASTIYEDQATIAFLDASPIAEGHTLVVPKKHYVDIFDIDPSVLRKSIIVAQKVAIRMRSAISASGVNLLNASGEAAEQGVSHFHIHVIPRKKADRIDFNAWWSTKVTAASRTDLNKLAARMRMK